MATGKGTNHKTWFIKQVLIKPCFVGVNGVLDLVVADLILVFI